MSFNSKAFSENKSFPVTTNDRMDKDDIKILTSRSNYGDFNNVITRNYTGFNHRNIPGLIPINKDFHGLVFFTRPELNLSHNNIRADRKMLRLAASEQNSIEAMIRCYLDSRLLDSQENRMPFPVSVDQSQAFIPILTNTLLSLPGWPDDVSQTWTSEPGVYGETFGFIDGPPDNRESFDLTANFRNVIGDPITKMFYYWTRYAKLVHEGLSLTPYLSNIIENRIDYTTRIYVLVLDETRNYVTEIAACGGAFPLSAPTGEKFNYDSTTPLNEGTSNQVSIPFRCFGFEVFDDILIKEFNSLVLRFNLELTEVLTANTNNSVETSNGYIKVPKTLLRVFNNYGYPFIHPVTRELQWWVNKERVAKQLLPEIDDILNQPRSSKDFESSIVNMPKYSNKNYITEK